MIGNDIVDLRLARLQSNWKRERWFQKVFTASEIEKIQASEEQNLQVWKFWSMKEATYKAHQRRFCISEKEVLIDQHKYLVQTECTTNYVYSIAYASKIKVNSKIFEATVDIKTKMTQSIFGQETLPYAITVLKNKNNIPVLSGNLYTHIPFSITHHGNYSAYATPK